MAIPSPPEHTLQVVTKGVFLETEWANVSHFHMANTVDPLPATMNAFAAACHDAWATHILPLQSTECAIQEVEALYYGAGGTQLDGSFAGISDGSDTGEVAPASCSVVVSKRVGVRWRGGHPRMYIGGLVADRIGTPGSFTSATVTDFQAGAVAWRAAIEGFSLGAFVNVKLACLRRFADRGSVEVPKVYLDPPEVVLVTSLLTRSHIGSQRRRLGHF